MKRVRNNTLLLLTTLLISISCEENPTPVEFLLVTEGNIVKDLGFSQGTAWADYDNDGDEDLFVTNSWTNGNNLFYQNNGDRTFNKIENIIVANDGGNSNGCTWGDVDNDGDIDLFVANVDNQNNFFYLNGCDGTFEKMDNDEASNDGGWSYTAAWADYNNDGWLDLFVGNYKNQSNFLYFNDGKGRLIRKKETIISVVEDMTQGCAWFDYDNDGQLDLYVVNFGWNNLYKNMGNGSFRKIEDIEPVKEKTNSFGCSAADYNNDGYTDLFVTTWRGKNNLYKNLGNGKFEKLIASPVTEESLNSEGSSWGDFDNDGDLDLIVTNDGNNSIFENQNNSFIKLKHLNVANDNSNSNGVTWNDIDNDGDLDIFVANGGNHQNLLYLNSGTLNNWIKIKCTGTISNHSAIGTKVTVFQKSNTQYRMVTSQTGGGYGGQNGLVLHYGLGGEERIDSVIVSWPSGNKSKIVKPAYNQTLSVIEN